MSGFGGMSQSAAGLVLAVSAVVFGATAVDALRVQELPAPGEEGGAATIETPPGAEGVPDTSQATAPGSEAGEPREGETGNPLTAGDLSPRPGGPYPRLTETELLEAVNQDVFQPERTPPLERYRLPNERVASAVVQQDPRRRRGPELRVVGSAITGDLALALVQVDDSIPLAVLLGESVEGYILAAVDQEQAVLVGDDETLTLPVVAPVPTSNPRARNLQIQMDPQNLEAIQQRVQQLLRNQLLNQRGQMMNRGGQLPPTGADPPGRGGRGGGGQS